MSSIEYFLLLKKNVQQQIGFFEHQKEFIQEIDSFDFDNNEHYENVRNILYSNHKLSDLFLDLKDCFLIENTLKRLELLKKEIENEIKNLCPHSWVKDFIDIDPDTSKEICYCCICESTFDKIED